MSNLFRKITKLSAFFFDKNWRENYFWQKISQRAAQLNGVPSINAN